MPTLNNRVSATCFAAVEDYMDVAFKHDLDPIHMALAWVTGRPFVTAAVFGARTPDQLIRILEGLETRLTDDVLEDIELVHQDHPAPY